MILKTPVGLGWHSRAFNTGNVLSLDPEQPHLLLERLITRGPRYLGHKRNSPSAVMRNCNPRSRSVMQMSVRILNARVTE